MKNYSLYKVKKAFVCICLTGKRFSMKQFCAFFSIMPDRAFPFLHCARKRKEAQ